MLLLSPASRASAQSAAGSDRFRFSLDGGAQLSSSAFDTSATKTVYIENAVIGTSNQIARGPSVDGGVSVRLAGDVGVA